MGEEPMTTANPMWDTKALVFNAVTRHPDCTVLYSNRQAVADKVVVYLTRQVRRMERKMVRRRRRWERKLGRRT